ncbi:MAG: hypothetical protein VKJ64_01745 [Leptolyngbyaceae bacterium]|nr:hypothetical protein [Leptolyngbyaceae bacterium]
MTNTPYLLIFMHLYQRLGCAQKRLSPSGSLTFATLLFTVFTFSGNYPSRAATPEQINVNDVLGNSSELLVRRSGRRESLQIGTLLQRIQDAIVTVPPNNARALLRFLDASGTDLNLYVQTNPHPESAIYYFPCQIEGGDELMGWGLARDAERGCEAGIRVSRGQQNRVQAEQLLQSPLVAQSLKLLTLDGMAQGAVRPVFYCSMAGVNGGIGFATAASGNPCTKALQQCQDSGGVDCTVITMGSWWTSEEKLYASVDCGTLEDPPLENDPASENPALPFASWIEGTGQTLEEQIETTLQQPPAEFCGVQVYRPDDFVIIPATDEVVLGLGHDETLVQVRDTPEGLQVDVLKGAINVRSPYNIERDRQLVTAGQRYDQASTGNTLTSFDQAAALTSVDMEVLCTFASTPSNNLKVSACAEQNLLLPVASDGRPTVAFCDREQASGGQAGDRRTVQMSTNSGEIRLEYEAFEVPDRFQIFYEGREILDTGPISYSETLLIPFSGRSGRVDVMVTGNPDISTTEWNYTLYCP